MEITNKRFMVIDGHPIPSFTHTQQLLQLLATMGWEGKKEGFTEGEKTLQNLSPFPSSPSCSHSPSSQDSLLESAPSAGCSEN